MWRERENEAYEKLEDSTEEKDVKRGEESIREETTKEGKKEGSAHEIGDIDG